MGFFSFKCAKTNLPIKNKYSIKGPTPCVLVTPEGNYIDYNYDGYGNFGGVDVYAWLAYANGLINKPLEEILNFMPALEEARDAGIDLFYSEKKPENYKPIKIVVLEYYNGETYDELPASEEDENQGL